MLDGAVSSLARNASFFLLLSASVLAGCSSTKELASQPAPSAPAIDGNAAEWQGKLTDMEDAGLLVGIENDAENVYLCVMAKDRAGSHGMMASGVTVWFDTTGGSDKRFGVHYPLGFQRPPAGDEESGASYRPMFNDLELLGPGKDDRLEIPTVISEREYGIKAAFHDSNGVAVVEMKIPRVPRQEPYGVRTASAVPLGVTIETGKSQARENMRGAGRTGSGGEQPPMGGGRGGRGGGRGGRGGGMGRPSGEGRRTPETVSLTLRVQLAQ